MISVNQQTFALLFTRKVSLQRWERLGILERELKPYKRFAQHFKKIYLFTYGSKKDLEYQKILPKNVIIVPNQLRIPSILYSFLLPLFYAKTLKRVDIIKTNQMDGSWAAVLVKWIYGSKLIVRCGYELLNFLEKEKKATWKRLFATFFERFAYTNADRIILTSQHDKKYVIDRFHISSLKIDIIPNWVDTNIFRPLLVKKEKHRIIFVGRLEEQKNLWNLFKAVEQLQVNLVMIGSGSLAGALKAYANEKGMEVTFQGNIPQDQLPEELNKSEIFILPSWYEGNPKVLLEAMACGLPCIGTDVEGIQTVIEHKRNGYLCDIDENAIRSAIQELFRDVALRETIGKNAKENIEAHSGFETVMKKELALYQSLVNT